MNIQNLVLDINKKCNQLVTANVGEVDSRFLKINIIDNGIPIDLTGVTVYLYAKKPDNTKIFNTVEVENAEQGIVSVEITSQVLAIEGFVKLTLLLTKGKSRLASKIFTLKVDETVVDDEALESSNEFKALDLALNKVDEWNRYLEETSGKLEEKYTERLNDVVSQLDIDYDSILSFDTQEGIIGNGIMGYIDNANKVILRDILPYGEYTLKYEYENGTQTEIKKFTIKNPNENLMKIGEIYLNQRYSKSGGGLVSDDNAVGMFSIIIPFETDGVKTHTLRFDNLKSSITASNANTLFLLDSNKKNPINVNGANEFAKMTQGVTVLDGGTSATVEFIGDTTKKYIVINLVVKSTELTLDDIADYVITLN